MLPGIHCGESLDEVCAKLLRAIRKIGECRDGAGIGVARRTECDDVRKADIVGAERGDGDIRSGGVLRDVEIGHRRPVAELRR